MADDPYKVLGVARDASADDIRKAYRKLAKENHPDLHPGDAAAEARFKAVSAAHDLLGDPDKRARFDSGEIDASGQERPEQQYYRHYADAGAEHPYHSTEGFADFADHGDVFSDLFGHVRGARGGRGGQTFRMRGGDARYSFAVDFLDAVNGAKQRIKLPDGASLDLTIPAGVRDGQVLRLKGKGLLGIGGGPTGDALVEVHVRPHKLFRREGDDIHIDLPVTPAEAVLGAKIDVPTTSGAVAMAVPKGSNSGTRLRLKGKGVATGTAGKRGDQYVTLTVVLPENPDDAFAAFLEQWEAEHPYDPRAGLGG
ncbi:MAG: DnaJ domain-containing protein [Alphaproteobacteria bacterium]|nr:DnaJ domain-containing protein [Alphaproteobacteria bacterium]